MVLPIVAPKRQELGYQNPDLLALEIDKQAELERESSFKSTAIGFAANLFNNTPNLEAASDDFKQSAYYKAAVKREPSVSLTTEEANNRFGIKDRLNFKTPVSEAYAEDRRNKVQRQIIIEQQLALADSENSLIDKAHLLITGSLAAQVVDTPVYMALGLESLVGRGLGMTALARTGKLGSAIGKSRFLRAAITGGVETAAVQPLIGQTMDYYGIDYGIKEATTDILIGAGLEGTIGKGLNLIKRAQGRARLKKFGEYNKMGLSIGNVLDSYYQRTVQVEHMAQARELSAMVQQSFQSSNATNVPDLVQALISLDHGVNTRRLDDRGFYHSDFAYRQDLNSLDPQTRTMVNERIQTETIIPSNRLNSPDRIAQIAENQPHRLTEFPDVHQKIAKLSSEGSVKFSDLADALGSILETAGLSKTKLRNLIKSDFGIDIQSNRDLIDVRQAYAIANKIDNDLTANKRKTLASEKDLLPLLQGFKDRLRALPSIADMKLKKFIDTFNSAKDDLFKNKKLLTVTLEDFQKLSDVNQNRILNYIRFFQEGDISRAEMDDILSGDIGTWKLIKERINYKKKYIDTMPTQQAYDTLRNNYESLVQDTLPVEMLREEPTLRQVDEDFDMPDSEVKLEIERKKLLLTEDEIRQFEIENTKDLQVLEYEKETREIVARCFLRGVV
jgi:hypothetical protein